MNNIMEKDKVKVLKRMSKNLFLCEASFVYAKRYGKEFDDFDDIWLSDDVNDIEYDNICKDLRKFRRNKDYELQYITLEEYKMCLEEFGYELI